MEQKTTFHTDTCCFFHAEAHELGIAKGTAECILDTLSDYGKIPLGLQEKISGRKIFAAEALVPAGAPWSYSRRIRDRM